jgi:hypothetical protein
LDDYGRVVHIVHARLGRRLARAARKIGVDFDIAVACERRASCCFQFPARR